MNIDLEPLANLLDAGDLLIGKDVTQGYTRDLLGEESEAILAVARPV